MENAELLNKLKSLLVVKHDPPPDDWKSTKEWAKVWSLPERSCRRYLDAALEAGLMEAKDFYPRHGGRCPAKHFREVESGGTAAARGCEKTIGTVG